MTHHSFKHIFAKPLGKVTCRPAFVSLQSNQYHAMLFVVSEILKLVTVDVQIGLNFTNNHQPLSLIML